MASKRFHESAVLLSGDGLSLEVATTDNGRNTAGRAASMVAEREKSLYEILQENKLEKESEFALRISRMNAPPGLDEEEANFLNDAVEQQEKTEMVRKISDAKEVAAYASAVREIVREAPEPERVSFMDPIFDSSVNADSDPPVTVVPRKRPRSRNADQKSLESTVPAKIPDRKERSPAASILHSSYSSSDED